MDFTTSHLFIALPEIIIFCMACIVILADVFVSERYRIVTYLLVQLTLLIAFVVTIPQFGQYPQSSIIFHGNYVIDRLAVISKLFIYLFSFFAFAYARDYLKQKNINRSEYYLLGIFCVLGMSVMASAFSFLTIFLGLELLSLALYAMIALYKDSNVAIEAAMKYFVLGSFASGLLLYGVSLFYGLTGSIQLDTVAHALQTTSNIVPIVALIFVAAGFLFKFGAVPFHMWVPDVYQGSGTPVTLFIASAPKVAAFVITLRILVQAVPNLQIDWINLLIVVSILSMFLGNVVAIAQYNLKRMLAYSSIAHIGYTLLGILAGPNSSQGYSAAMFYITTYVIVVAGAFAIISILSSEGIEFDKLDDYRGLNSRSPWLAFLMLLLLFSMAGVPPTVGFFAKLGLLEALIQAQYVWLAVVALLLALIGAYYYLRVVMLMYFEEPAEDTPKMPVSFSKDTMVLVSINGLAALLLGLLPSYLIDICRITVG